MAERWKQTFRELVEQNEQLPVADPVQNTDTYIFAREDQLFIHVEGEGDYPIEVEDAAKDHTAWLSIHMPTRIPG